MSNNKLKEIKTSEANPKFVNFLERLLTRAKTGEVQGIVGVIIFDSGVADDFWYKPSKQWHTSIVSDRVVGALEALVSGSVSGVDGNSPFFSR